MEAALRKAGVPGDSPAVRNPPKFSSSDSDLLAIIDSPLVPGSSSQAPPAASAGPKARAAVPPEAPTVVDAAPEALQATPEATAFKATPTDPEVGSSKVEAPQGIDCNVEAVVP